MARSYRPVDRAQRFLLPPDMQEWLPEDHLVWLVIEVVDRVDTTVLHRRHPLEGVGRRAYDPDMLLTLLIYSYCVGVRSSRQIERLCETDVAYRVICASDSPDHTTIARFRQAHTAVAQQLFVEVLAVCAQAGLAKVGVVAVDGTKMAADASMNANRNRAQIEAEVADMFAQAETVDDDEDRLFGDRRGDELPAELGRRDTRAAHLDTALAVVKADEARRRADQEAARHAQEQAAQAAAAAAAAEGRLPPGRPTHSQEVVRAEAKLEKTKQAAAERRAQVEARAAAEGRRPTGPPPGKGHRVAKYEARLAQAQQRAAERQRQAEAAAADPTGEVKVNVTDPDSRIMKSPKGWVQGYNAQAAVTQDGLIVAAVATQDHNDLAQCVPMMQTTTANLAAAHITETVGVVLFDAGYCSDANLTAAGPDRLIATTKSWKLRRDAKRFGFIDGDPPPDITATQAMEHRLRTQEGARLYGLRQHTVEPVFGDTKHNRGITRFARRGLRAVDAEWKLIATTHNLLKLHRHHLTNRPTT
jgi:transposase